MRTIILLLCATLFIGCSSTKNTIGSIEQAEMLDGMMNQKAFTINSRSASPVNSTGASQRWGATSSSYLNNSNYINLTDNANYFKLDGDQVSIDLPYFGNRVLGSINNGNDNAIKFEGVPRKMKITHDEDKKRYRINLEIKKNIEVYTINVTLNSNLTSQIDVNSTHRSAIAYKGTVKE